MNQVRAGVAVLLLAAAPACANQCMEKAFFRQLSDRVPRARQLSLEDQYKVFRYANDVIHPPLMEMAVPIAERGASAVSFVLEKLAANDDLLTTRDTLLVFQRMATSKSYDVKGDHTVMAALTSRSRADRR